MKKWVYGRIGYKISQEREALDYEKLKKTPNYRYLEWIMVK